MINVKMILILVTDNIDNTEYIFNLKVKIRSPVQDNN